MTGGAEKATASRDDGDRSPGAAVRALLATNVPFWRLENGSHRRIEAMVRSLAESGVRWSLAYVADEDFPSDLSRFGIVEARRLPHTLGPAPHGLAGIASKHWKGTLNALRVAASRFQSADDRAPVAPKRLADFVSGEAIDSLADWLGQDRFDVVLVEYVHLAYLYQANAKLAADRQPTWAIDTHDVMWVRAARHAEAGQSHWLAIDRDEESAALAPFDAVLAIQAEERATLAEMLPGKAIVLAPHAIEAPAIDERAIAIPQRFDASRPLSIGFIGSGGAMNLDSARRLLEEIWPRIEEVCGDAVRIVLAGDAAARYRDSVRSPRVTFLGRVDDLGDYYRAVDVSVNPVSFGAGLKIKNVEALAYGKALVTTSIGAAGMEAGAGSAFAVADDADAFADTVVAWVRDPESLQAFARRGREFAEKTFSPAAAYGKTLALFRESAERRRS